MSKEKRRLKQNIEQIRKEASTAEANLKQKKEEYSYWGSRFNEACGDCETKKNSDFHLVAIDICLACSHGAVCLQYLAAADDLQAAQIDFDNHNYEQKIAKAEQALKDYKKQRWARFTKKVLDR